MKTIAMPREAVHRGPLILVNGQHRLRWDCIDAELITVDNRVVEVQIQREVAEAYRTVTRELASDEQIVATSGYRSEREQESLYDEALAEHGTAFTSQYVALPGHSEHQTGLALDLSRYQQPIDLLRPDFPYNGICQLFRRLAAAHGLVERYPLGKEGITGIAHEPWHFRYVGRPHGAIMQQNGLTLEEYLALIERHPHGGWPISNDHFEIAYVKANAAGDTVIEVPSTVPYDISGDNMGGFIVTIWRKAS